MLCNAGRLSLFCFVTAVVLSVSPELFLRLELNVYHDFFTNIWLVHVCQYALLNLLVLLPFRGFSYQVAVRSAFLGYAFGLGLLIYTVSPLSWQTFGIYVCVLSFFHYSEFLTIAWINPKEVSVDSFILNHSVAYTVAACSSWLEFLVERHHFPEMKQPSSISYFGLILCISGEFVRKLAMHTARHNFSHLVQDEKQANHELVTYGIYRIWRHPSYVGWFYWSVGTQLILQNPFCFLAYTWASWKFFHDRIFMEEITLLNFFGGDYADYQEKVGTGLPFIYGYPVKKSEVGGEREL